MIKLIKKKNINIVCPKNRIDNYLAYCSHVFEIENINFFEKIKFLDNNQDILIVDQKNLINDNLSYLLKKNINLIVILLWNSDRDYSLHKFQIDKLRKIFNVKLISLSNFSPRRYFPINSFSIKKKSSLKFVSGIGITKKIKFFYPTIYGIYNSLKYIENSSNFFFKKKLVFVGIGNHQQTIDQLKWLIQKNYSKNINNICKIMISDIKKLTYKSYNHKFYKLFNTKKYQEIPIQIKYFLTQISIRYLILSHLNKFENFYHKHNSSYPLDLLRTNIYKNIYHLDLGSQSGNAYAHIRKIYLHKFHKNKFIEINVFKNNENYRNKQRFKLRFNEFNKKLNEFYNFEDFSSNLHILISNIKKLKSY